MDNFCTLLAQSPAHIISNMLLNQYLPLGVYVCCARSNNGGCGREALTIHIVYVPNDLFHLPISGNNYTIKILHKWHLWPVMKDVLIFKCLENNSIYYA